MNYISKKKAGSKLIALILTFTLLAASVVMPISVSAELGANERIIDLLISSSSINKTATAATGAVSLTLTLTAPVNPGTFDCFAVKLSIPAGLTLDSTTLSGYVGKTIKNSSSLVNSLIYYEDEAFVDIPFESPSVVTMNFTVLDTSVVADYPITVIDIGGATTASFAMTENTGVMVPQDQATTFGGIKVVDTAPTVDKAALIAAISDAETLIDSKTEGTAVGNVPSSAKVAYQSAISTAILVRDNASATQTEVDEAVGTLATATTAFNNSVITASSNANLSALTVTGATLNEPFAVSKLNYTATVANSVEEITINATTEDANATFTGDGLKSLVVGPNPFEINVTAQDGTPKKYTITITREAPAVVGAAVKAGNVDGYVGLNVVVPITITDMTALNCFDIGISYDSSKLQYVSTAKGASLTETPAVYAGTTGKVGLAGLTVAHGVAGLSGDVVVANITFKVIGTVTGNNIVTSDIIVLSGRYNSTDVTGANLVKGIVSYTNATDPLIGIADAAVEDFEDLANAATTISEIEAALASTILTNAQDAVEDITLPESQAAKDALQDRIDAAIDDLNDRLDVLLAEEAATELVEAYETVPLTNFVLVEEKALAAYSAVNALSAGTVQTGLLERLAARDKEVALAKINAGDATWADFKLIASGALESLVANYARGVVAGGSDLTAQEVIDLVAQVNTPAAPVISHVTIVGQAVTGVELAVTYDYYDANYDLDAGQTIIWTVGTAPTTASTYTIAASDVGKTITVSVAGVSNSVTLDEVILRGDVTKDGFIKADDAYDIREIYFETPGFTAQEIEAADYDNSGEIHVKDFADVLDDAAAGTVNIDD